MTPAQFRAALKALGLTYHTAAKRFDMGRWGFQSVGKWARGETAIPPGIALATELMLEREGITLND